LKSLSVYKIMIQSIQERRKDTKEKKQNGGKIGGENRI